MGGTTPTSTPSFAAGGGGGWRQSATRTSTAHDRLVGPGPGRHRRADRPQRLVARRAELEGGPDLDVEADARRDLDGLLAAVRGPPPELAPPAEEEPHLLDRAVLDRRRRLARRELEVREPAAAEAQQDPDIRPVRRDDDGLVRGRRFVRMRPSLRQQRAQVLEAALGLLDRPALDAEHELAVERREDGRTRSQSTIPSPHAQPTGVPVTTPRSRSACSSEMSLAWTWRTWSRTALERPRTGPRARPGRSCRCPS